MEASQEDVIAPHEVVVADVVDTPHQLRSPHACNANLRCGVIVLSSVANLVLSRSSSTSSSEAVKMTIIFMQALLQRI